MKKTSGYSYKTQLSGRGQADTPIHSCIGGTVEIHPKSLVVSIFYTHLPSTAEQLNEHCCRQEVIQRGIFEGEILHSADATGS
ncbi:uncharacterized protein ARMOST_14077 [Armillaria ostoyae]|uniref:Uncharacterized protein n=1 Tax=Armillaria ostoyae TaxID=47428 RepID=A0A284RPJ8_ARMOS|nr:uncharacterized protein ARMOST_14077 [Armillaria ostoyae]